MHRLLLVALALTLLIGCGGNDGPNVTVPSVSVSLPSGEEAKQAAFVTAAVVIKTELRSNRDRVISAGRSTCQDLAAGKDRPTVVASAVQRFGTDTLKVSQDEADKLVTAAERTLC